MTNDAGTTSLVTTRLTVDEVRRCPRKIGWYVRHIETGEILPAGCLTYGCEVCAPVVAQRLARVVSDHVRSQLEEGERVRFVTLTQAPDEFQRVRQKMRDLRRLLRRRGYDWEQFWSVERGSKTGMRHVHAVQTGSYVPQALLQDVWGARTDIRAVGTSGVSRYVLKDAGAVVGYSVKGARTDAGVSEHLALNGGRVAHWSRGFLPGPLKDLQRGDGAWALCRISETSAATTAAAT